MKGGVNELTEYSYGGKDSRVQCKVEMKSKVGLEIAMLCYITTRTDGVYGIGYQI